MEAAQQKDNYIVSRSETGHHHILEGSTSVLEREGRNTIIAIDEPSRLTHKKTTDRHDDVIVPKGIFRVLKKQEFDPFLKIMREVWD